MAYLALYRKYRPKTFDNLIGQEHIVKTLVHQIENNRPGHAYLFTGTRGTGKTSVAKIFAKAINCLNPKNGSPCGECEVCKALSDTSNIDILEIDAASNNGVNEIRELRENVQYPPVTCKYKVYIIDEVHMLTGAAFNALLKTLEEPPKHVIFILATTEAHKIPSTILSRCMRFDFRLIPTEKIANLISSVYDEQGKKYQKEAVYAIAKAGEGSIRDALSVADVALSYGEGELTYNDVMDILGSTGRETLIAFIKNVISGDTGAVLSDVNVMASMGKSFGVLIKEITSILRDILVVKTCENANQILALPKQIIDEYVNISNSTNKERILRILEIFSETENQLKYSFHPRVIFETASVKATKPQTDYDVEALLSRIKTLEDKLDNIMGGAVITPAQKCQNENKDIKNEEVLVEANKVENIVEQTQQTQENLQNTKQQLSSLSSEQAKGKLLTNLRNLGSEMLWSVMQNVGVEVSGNILVLTPQNVADVELLELSSNRSKIEDAMELYLPFELEIKANNKDNTEEIDNATDKYRKIFGDDIVIVKH